jgi:hypothetical protein
LAWETGSRIGALVFSAVCLAISASPSASAEEAFVAGDSWLYDYTSDYDGAVMTGTMNLYYVDLTTKSVSGYEYEVYEFRGEGYFTWSGSMYGYPVSGTSSMLEHLYLDVSSQSTIIDDYNLSDSLMVSYIGEPIYIEGWTHNITTYTPPGGVGTRPSMLSEGESWMISYTERCEEQSYDGYAIYSSSCTFTEVCTYTVLDWVSVTVPAGTFDCWVIQESAAGSIYTRWYSEEVGNDVKIVSDSNSRENVSMTLRSYSYTPTSGPVDSSLLYVGIGVAVAVVPVIVVVLLLMRSKRGPATAMPPPPATVLGPPIGPA